MKDILDLLKKLSKSGVMGSLSSPIHSVSKILDSLVGGGTSKPKETGESPLEAMFRTLMEKLDRLADKLDSFVSPQVTASKENLWAPQGKKGSAYGKEYDFADQLNKILQQSPNPNLSGLLQGLMQQGTFGKNVNVAAGGSGGGAGNILGNLLGGGAGGAGAGADAAGAGAAGAALPIAALIEGLKLIVENFQTIKQRVGEAGEEGAAAFKSEKIQDAGEHAIGGVKAAGGAFGRMVGGPIAGPLIENMIANNPILLMAEAGFKAVGFLRDFSEQLIKTNLRFAEFSGAMAAVQAQFEIQNIQLSIQHGEARAASTSQLAAAQFKTEQALAPLEDAWSNIKSDVMTSFNDLFEKLFGSSLQEVGTFLDQTREWGRKVAFWVDWDKKKREADEIAGATRQSGENLNRFAREMNDWMRRGRQGLPPRL